MPVFKSGKGLAPEWCELDYFDIIRLEPGETHSYSRDGLKERLIVGAGKCRIAFAGEEVDAGEGSNLDLVSQQGYFEVTEVSEPATLVRMCGRWGDESGGSGLFNVKEGEGFQDVGDPVDYPKKTSFDSHYHDCDEYWIIFEGRGTVVSEGKQYEVGPGDCVATGMGHRHDFPLAPEPVRAVYFEASMEGEKRPGHLWEHKHGPAQPQMGRS